MEKMLTQFNKTMAYFFTPEDSTAASSSGDVSFSINRSDLDMGGLKVLFWVLTTMGGFYLITLI